MIKKQKNLGKKLLENSFENKITKYHQIKDFKNKSQNSNKTGKKLLGNDKSSSNYSKILNRSFLVKSSKNFNSNIHNIFFENENKAEIKVLNNRRKLEITYLCKERARLQKVLSLTKDITSLRLISQRITNLNKKLLKLIKIKENTDSKSEKPKIKVKKILKNNFTDSEKENSEYSENEYKSDIPLLKKIKKVNNYLKINDIIQIGKVIDLHTNIVTIKDKPSYIYQREKEPSLFNPSIDLSNEKRKLGITTIFNRSFRPIGFTHKSYLENEKKDILQNTFDDIFYNIEEKSKRRNSSISASIKKSNEKNDISQRKTATCSARSKQKKPKVTLVLGNKQKKKLNLSDYINNDDLNNSTSKININTLNNNNSKLDLSDNRSNSFIKSKINQILNDSYIIKDSIEQKIQKEEKPKKKNDNILLKLANKIKPKTSIIKKNKKIISQENEYAKRLKLIPKSCKEEYRECFKKILYEDRILNHPQKKDVNIINEKMQFLKELKNIKEEAQKTMFILRENILTGREDKDVFKEEKIYGNYGNITGLEYLIRKKTVLYNKKKINGAYNPKDKPLVINYPI
jgi:hypothetical protein